MKTKIVEVKINNEQRFIIVDEETDEILDNAQGYGFKSIDSANKIWWFKYGGGEQKINAEKAETKKFFEENPIIKDFIINYYNIHFKDSMRGLLATDALIEAVKEEFGVELKKIYIKYF